ncbi:MAG: hypothetical protein Q8K75_04290 [Chlamydiales bacterium]|nr:hypothetical protein [Chlamydiales bacterium]
MDGAFRLNSGVWDNLYWEENPVKENVTHVLSPACVALTPYGFQYPTVVDQVAIQCLRSGLRNPFTQVPINIFYKAVTQKCAAPKGVAGPRAGYPNFMCKALEVSLPNTFAFPVRYVSSLAGSSGFVLKAELEEPKLELDKWVMPGTTFVYQILCNKATVHASCQFQITLKDLQFTHVVPANRVLISATLEKVGHNMASKKKLERFAVISNKKYHNPYFPILERLQFSNVATGE